MKNIYTLFSFLILISLLACDDSSTSNKQDVPAGKQMTNDQLVKMDQQVQDQQVQDQQVQDQQVQDQQVQDQTLNPNQDMTTGLPIFKDPSVCQSMKYQQMGPYAVGLIEKEIEGSKVAIWYPASIDAQNPQAKASYDMRDWLPSEIASQIPDADAPIFEMNAYWNLPMAEGSFPVVLFAHGLAGYRYQSSTLMAHLASWGMIVTSAENTGIHLTAVLSGATPNMDMGANFMQSTYAGLNTWQNESPFLGRVNLQKVAAMGHSLGTSAIATISTESYISSVVALAGAGFAQAAPKPLFVMGGTTDALANVTQLNQAYDQQTADIKRKVILEGAGHLAFSDICEIAKDRGGLLNVASNYGLMLPLIIRTLGQDGCRPTDMPMNIAWPMINHFVTAHLKQIFAEDSVLEGFEQETRDCLDTLAEVQTSDDMGNGMMGGMTAGAMGGMMAGVMGGMAGGMAGGMTGSNGEQMPGIPNEVTCGMQSCDIRSNYCCIGFVGATCQNTPCTGLSAPQRCDGPEDCSGDDICCVGFPAGASCGANTGSLNGCGVNQEALCHQDEDCLGGRGCYVCDYPGNSKVKICSQEGYQPAGSIGCRRLSR